MSDPFLCGLLADTEAEIKAAMMASSEASADGIISYTFNSGQTVQTVTKASVGQMKSHIDSLLAQRDTLRQRCGLSVAVFNAGPAW